MHVASVVLFALLCYQGVATATEDGDDNSGNTALAKSDIYNLHVESHIRFRFAHTVISSRIANPNNVSQEVSFSAVLPETAFISGFLVEVDGQVYHAYVKEKEAASQEYREAVAHGRTAAHVAMSARDSNRFTVSVNVEPQKKVTFNLTYEELLTRTLGAYKHVINLDPGQIVRDLSVEVRIEESRDIASLVVPALRTSNEIDAEPSSGSTNNLATVERPTPQSAVIKFAPTPDQQRELASEGIKGQLVVEYDVNRMGHPGEVLMNDGYFVHFFAPTELPPLPKQVTFVLDVSGSMGGRKIEQLRQAMTTILGDLNAADIFSIVIFSSTVQVWDSKMNETTMLEKLGRLGAHMWRDITDEPMVNETLSRDVIALATPENIAKAKQFVGNLTPLGATNIYGALKKALDISKLGTEDSSREERNEVAATPEPIIIFLTDGQPNVEVSDTGAIVTGITAANTGNSSIFSLALGYDAELSFLKKLSLRNTGFARKIYEASDTALQLRDFYRQVASPLLSDVTFSYQPEQVDTVTKLTFRRFFSGSELVVAGKLQGTNITAEVLGQSSSGSKSYTVIPTPPILLPIPLPTPEEPANTTASPMERLWAYLTIQQLLEEEETRDHAKNHTSPEKQRALELALRYSFVTPLTSLVVVKPNDTSSVDPEDASDYDSNSDPVAVRNLGFLRPNQHSYRASAPYLPAASAAAGPPGPAFLTANLMPRAGVQSVAQSLSTFQFDEGHLSLGGAPGIPPGPSIANLSDVTWLTPDTTSISLQTGVNGTIEVLQLASANETNTEHTSCATPAGLQGHCRHFRFCVLDVFVDLQAHFIPYLCRISSYAGVCCPDSIPQVAG